MKDKIYARIDKLAVLILSFAMIFTLFTGATWVTSAEAESSSAGFEKFPEYGNILKNPELNYVKEQTTIPDWKISYSSSIASPIDGFHSATIDKGESTTHSGFRKINAKVDRFYVGEDNPAGSASNFKSKSILKSAKGYSDNSVVLYAQTIQLKPGQEYYYSSDLSSNNGTSYGNMIVYPGERVSGTGGQADHRFTINETDGRYIFASKFTAKGDGKVTFSLRHFVNQNPETVLNIHRMGFFLKDDYEIQDEVKTLFEDSDFTSLAGATPKEIQDKIDAINKKINEGQIPYSEDVKQYVIEQTAKAQALLDPAKTLEDEVLSKFKPGSTTSALDNLTQEDINKLKEKVPNIKGSGLRETLTNEIENLQLAYNLDQLKIEKSNALKDKEKDVQNQINEMTFLTDEEKEDYQDLLAQIQDTGVSEIYKQNDKESVQNEYSKAYEDLVAKLDEAALKDSKRSSVAELKNKAEEAKKEIDALENLTEEEKQEKKDAIDKQVEESKKAIDDATKSEEVEQSLAEGKEKIDNIVKGSQLEDKKSEAIKDLENKANETKEKIDALENVSKESKDKAKKDIDDELNNGKSKINTSETIEDVNNNLDESKKTMDNVYDNIQKENADALLNAKEQANSKLDEAAKKAKETIDSLNNLSDEEKIIEKGKVDKIVSEAKTKIDEANLIDEVENETNKGIKDIDKLLEEAKFKDAQNDAIAQLKKKADEVRKKISEKPSLTDEQRKTAETEINQVLNDGIQRIQNTESMDTLPNDLQTGKDQLDAIDVKYEAIDKDNFDDQKEAAKSDLDKKAEEAKKEIDALENLTEEEKQEKKDALNKQVDESKKAIDDATKPEEVEQSLTDGKEKIEDIVKDSQLQDKKSEAIKNLDKKAEDTKKKIEELEGVSPERKQEAIDAIDKELSEGKENINNASTEEEVDASFTDSQEKIDEIYSGIKKENDQALSEKREEANNKLDEAAKKAKESIDSLENLSDAQKQAEKDKVDATVAEAKKEIAESISPKEIDDYTNKGIKDIDKLLEEAKFKDAQNDAISQLKKKADKVKKRIKSKTFLSEKDKEKAYKLIDETLNNAIERVKETESMETLAKDLQAGKEELDAIDVKYEAIDKEKLGKLKEDAKSDIDKKANEAKKEVDKLKHLSDKQKEEKKKIIDQEASNAKKIIDEATTIQSIDSQKDVAISRIDKIIQDAKIDDQKSIAIKELESRAEKLIEKINKISGLDNKRKQEAINNIKNELSKATEQVNKSITIKQILQEKQLGIAKMEKIYKDLQDERRGLPATGMSNKMTTIGSYFMFIGAILISVMFYFRRNYAQNNK